jgi:uncharacterized CHY-type Zn-finger protein
MKPSVPPVIGVDLDSQTRCAHYRSDLDVIAIKMKCCGTYYACKDCHEALAGHPIEVWPRAEWDQPAVLCGVCATEMTIRQYLACSNQCPNCAAQFNPGCRTTTSTSNKTHQKRPNAGRAAPRAVLGAASAKRSQRSSRWSERRSIATNGSAHRRGIPITK